MKRKPIVIAAVAVVLLSLAFYMWLPGSAPPGQPPLVRLAPGNLSPFTSAFDADANLPRVVLLLSPT